MGAGVVRGAIVAAGLLVLGVPGAAAAGDSDDEGASRFEKMAKRAYHDKRFGDAIAAFEAAYENDPLPKYLYNIGRCHEKEGALDEAIGFLERYLEDDPGAVDRDQVSAHIEVLRKKLEKTHGELKVWSKPAGSLVQVSGPSGEKSGSTPYTRWFPFGEYTVRVSRRDHETIDEKVVIQPAQPASVFMELKKTGDEGGDGKYGRARRAPRTSDGPGGALNWPGWAVLGVGVAALGGGVAMGIMGLADAEARDDLLDKPVTKDELPARREEATDLDEAAKTKGLVSNVLYVAGGLAVAGGVVLLLLGGDDDPSGGGAGVVPAPGGLLVVWEMSL